jgi:putative ABC transport system ATP-binding protein
LDEAAEDAKRAVLVVTHDDRIFPFADRIVRMEDGRIMGEGLINLNPIEVIS